MEQEVKCTVKEKCKNTDTLWCKLCEGNEKNSKQRVKGFFFNVEEHIKETSY